MRGVGETVGVWGEDRLVARIRRLLDPPPEGSLGIGDDAAALPSVPGTLLLTTDVLLEGSHFRPGWFTAGELGWKALAVNLSDAAAMGGEGRAALVSLILPPDTPVLGVEAFFRGMARLARRHRTVVVGGNLARGNSFSATVALAGALSRGSPLRRSGARPGDRVIVTGQPGLARLGLGLLAARAPRTAGPRALSVLEPPAWRRKLARSSPAAGRALARFLTPAPRVVEGGEFARFGANALMDLSDGIAVDLPRLAAAAEVAVVLDPSRFPLPRGFRDLAGALGEDPVEAFLEGGEDYELVAAVPPDIAARLGRGARAAGVPFTDIGSVVEGRGLFVLGEGGPRPWIAGGFDHFLPTKARPSAAPRRPARRAGKGRSRR